MFKNMFSEFIWHKKKRTKITKQIYSGYLRKLFITVTTAWNYCMETPPFATVDWMKKVTN